MIYNLNIQVPSSLIKHCPFAPFFPLVLISHFGATFILLQAYTNELEFSVAILQKENARLKAQQKQVTNIPHSPLLFWRKKQ